MSKNYHELHFLYVRRTGLYRDFTYTQGFTPLYDYHQSLPETYQPLLGLTGLYLRLPGLDLRHTGLY